MTVETGRTRFHYGFYAVMKVEYDIIHANVTYEQEIQLGEDPIRLDFLILKKDASVILSDLIGEFFKAVNLFEYKSPEDGLSIDDFYKAQSYWLIYKGFDRKVNELPIENMTLTLICHSYPRELMKALKNAGFIIHEEYSGIFRVEGKISIPVQVVISSRLPEGEYEGLKLLASGCTKDAVLYYAERAVASGDENIKTNAGTVIGVCLDINEKLGSELKEDGVMNEVIRDIFKKDFNEAESRGVNKEKERVATDVLRDGEPLEKIARYSRLAEDTIRNLAKNLGVAIL